MGVLPKASNPVMRTFFKITSPGYTKVLQCFLYGKNIISDSKSPAMPLKCQVPKTCPLLSFVFSSVLGPDGAGRL
jgi:hypothetical protein